MNLRCYILSFLEISPLVSGGGGGEDFQEILPYKRMTAIFRIIMSLNELMISEKIKL